MYLAILGLHLFGLVLGLGGALGGRMVIAFAKENDIDGLLPLARKFAMVNLTGLLLLVSTGFALALQQRVALDSAAFQLKLALVGILILFTGFVHMSQARFRRSGNQKFQMAAAKVQPLALITTLSILITAVIAFN